MVYRAYFPGSGLYLPGGVRFNFHRDAKGIVTLWADHAIPGKHVARSLIRFLGNGAGAIDLSEHGLVGSG